LTSFFTPQICFAASRGPRGFDQLLGSFWVAFFRPKIR
jgi:hypothetical protein